MCTVCIMHKTTYNVLENKLEIILPFVRSWRKRDDNISTDIKEIGQKEMN